MWEGRLNWFKLWEGKGYQGNSKYFATIILSETLKHIYAVQFPNGVISIRFGLDREIFKTINYFWEGFSCVIKRCQGQDSTTRWAEFSLKSKTKHYNFSFSTEEKTSSEFRIEVNCVLQCPILIHSFHQQQLQQLGSQSARLFCIFLNVAATRWEEDHQVYFQNWVYF